MSGVVGFLLLEVGEEECASWLAPLHLLYRVALSILLWDFRFAAFFITAILHDFLVT